MELFLTIQKDRNLRGKLEALKIKELLQIRIKTKYYIFTSNKFNVIIKTRNLYKF